MIPSNVNPGGSGLTPLDPDPSGVYDYPVSITLNEYGQATAVTPGAAGAPAAQRVVAAFILGGGIGQWQIWPNIRGDASYWWANGTNPVGAVDTPLLRSPSGGTYSITFRYDSDINILLTFRKESGGVWSTLSTTTLDAAQVTATATVTLAAGESLGIHANPGGNGSVANLLLWEVLL